MTPPAPTVERSFERLELILAFFLDFAQQPNQCVRYQHVRMSASRSDEHAEGPTRGDWHLDDGTRDDSTTRRPVGAARSDASSLSRRAFLAGTTGGAALALAGCSMGTKQLFTGGSSGTTLSVAIVSNSQMQDAISLSHLFESEHPDIHLNFISLPENEARAKITTDVSTQGGEFDVVMISNYETPMWSANGWLVNLQPYIDRTPGYDANDFLPQLRATLSHQGDLYSVPFYGESSFLMYRKDLMAKAGIKMPTRPTWDQVGKIAAQMHNEKKGLVGICLRGDPGWGENLAPIDTVINSFGGRWYDPALAGAADQPGGGDARSRCTCRWCARTASPAPRRPASPNAPRTTARAARPCGTTPPRRSALIEDPPEQRWSARTATPGPRPRTAARPAGSTPGRWPSPPPAPTSRRPGTSSSWMTSKSYIKTVGRTLGWSHVPPGSRFSSYRIPQYKKLSAVYGPLTLAVDQRDQHGAPDAQAGALHRGPVPGHPRVPGPRHQRQPADQRRHRRAEVGGVGARRSRSTTPRPSATPTRSRRDERRSRRRA